MKKHWIYRTGAALVLAGTAGHAAAQGVGPDVYVADVWQMAYFGAANGISVYAVGSWACNGGTAPVDWYQNTNRHPMITGNMYRLMNGRFEQLGQCWCKHGFGSDNGTFCGPCTQPPDGWQQCGVGCSDAYYATQNGTQSDLGPRSQINGRTAFFVWPTTGAPVTSIVDRRLQVPTTDVTPALNPGALYFAEGRYTAADDAAADNGLNNASYRQILIPSATATPVLTASTHAMQPAIQAWNDQDSSVSLVTADYVDTGITSRFWVAGKATDNGNGTWHYEYALYNHNSDRCAGSFSVPGNGTITNTGFHAPQSHSGEPYSNAPWMSSMASGVLTFATTPYAMNPNANAVRWGTLYNFRFDSTAAPVSGQATIGLFVPGGAGAPASLVAAGLPVPGAGAACYANCDGSTTAPVLNVDDFACFMNRFAAHDPYANCDGSTTPPIFNVNDFACFVNAFAAGCP